MFLLNPLPLIASAALLLAAAGCTVEKLDRAGGVLPAATAASVMHSAGGQEIHMMFEAQKREAQAGDLPAQF